MDKNTDKIRGVSSPKVGREFVELAKALVDIGIEYGFDQGSLIPIVQDSLKQQRQYAIDNGFAMIPREKIAATHPLYQKLKDSIEAHFTGKKLGDNNYAVSVGETILLKCIIEDVDENKQQAYLQFGTRSWAWINLRDMMIAELKLSEDRDWPIYTKCSVCSQIYVNQAGSTPCCGGMNEILYASELKEMNIDPEKTKNRKIEKTDD